MTRNPESRIEIAIVKKLESFGFECPKVGYDGYPDRIVLSPDRRLFCWLEVKTEKGRLTKAQKVRIPNLRRKGDFVVLVSEFSNQPDTVDAVVQVLRGWFVVNSTVCSTDFTDPLPGLRARLGRN